MTNKPRFVGERELVKLGEIAKIKAGNVAPKKDAFTEDGMPFVRAGSLTNLLAGGSLADLEKIDGGAAQKLHLTLFPAGTVVFAKSGMSCMTGNIYVLPKPCYVVSHLACVIPNGNYASYLKHYFRFNRPNRLIENPSFPSIKLSKIQEIELRLPSPEEGVMQVQALERIESQIEQVKALLTHLDPLIKSRFVEMFGDPYLNTTGSPLVTIEKYGTNRDAERRPVTKSDREVGQYPYYGASGVVDYVSEYIFDEPLLLISEDGANLIARTYPIAFLADGKTWVNNHAHVISCFNGFDRVFLAWHIDMMDVTDYVTGSTQPKINQANLNKIPLLFPPESVRKEFAAFVQQVDKLKYDGPSDICPIRVKCMG